MQKDTRIDYWIELAEYDLETARVMLEGRRYLYVGFMCQQVIEKALKAYFCLLFKEFPPHTHNLFNLAEKCQLLTILDEIQIDLLGKLNPLNIEARYPSTKMELAKALNKEVCKELIDKTEDLFKWIKKRL